MSSELDLSHSKNRNFICSCQKAYLSYAALFTHIKQKHGGKAPGQIVRPRSLNKRGRPRKSEKPGIQKLVKSESYNGLSQLDNNIKNGKHSNYNLNQLQPEGDLPFGRSFTSYTPGAAHNEPVFKRSLSQREQVEESSSGLNHLADQCEQQNMQFASVSNQFSNNTLTLASIIIGLQQIFKDATKLEFVKDEKLEAFLSYGDLKRYHAMKLTESLEDKKKEDVFMLGNVVCAFLNFCHQTIDSKASYQQIVLLMVSLLQHIKQQKPNRNILTQCRKQVIHECLPSFFESFLQKIVGRQRMNYWIFRENNSFKVLIWFLNWLSAIEVNYLKSSLGKSGEMREEEKLEERKEAGVNKSEECFEEKKQPLNKLRAQRIFQEEQSSQSQDIEHFSQNQVQFQNPVFLQLVVGQKPQAQNQTIATVEKKPQVNDQKGELSCSQSVRSQQKLEQECEDLNCCGENQRESIGQSEVNEMVGLDRLSSEVR